MINRVCRGFGGTCAWYLQLQGIGLGIPLAGYVLCYLVGIHGSSKQPSPCETGSIESILSFPIMREGSLRKAIFLAEEILLLVYEKLQWDTRNCFFSFYNSIKY